MISKCLARKLPFLRALKLRDVNYFKTDPNIVSYINVESFLIDVVTYGDAETLQYFFELAKQDPKVMYGLDDQYNSLIYAIKHRDFTKAKVSNHIY